MNFPGQLPSIPIIIDPDPPSPRFAQSTCSNLDQVIGSPQSVARDLLDRRSSPDSGRKTKYMRGAQPHPSGPFQSPQASPLEVKVEPPHGQVLTRGPIPSSHRPEDSRCTQDNHVFFFDTERLSSTTEKRPPPGPTSPVRHGLSCPHSEPALDTPPQLPQAPDEPRLSDEQRRLVDLITSGRNVFYTGSAGSGKSTVLKAAVKALKSRGLNVQLLLQRDGQRCRSVAAYRKSIRRRLCDTNVLIIDEISMVENNHFERMHRCMGAARQWSSENPDPFGGAQIVVTGDFCQLPPVKPFAHCVKCGRETIQNDTETEFSCPSGEHGPFREQDKWAFKSDAWEKCNFEHVHLNEIHRQSDHGFVRILQKCRLGADFTMHEKKVLLDHPCNVEKATQLYPTREEAQRVNREKFARMKTPIVTYYALDGFNWNPEHHPQLRRYNDRSFDGTLVALKDHRMERQVNLRAGMLVVLQVNLSLTEGLCNGSQGIICGWEHQDPARLPRARTRRDPASDQAFGGVRLISGEYSRLKAGQVQTFSQIQGPGKAVQFWPRVLFHNGVKRTIYAECVVNAMGDVEPYSLLHRTQIPLAPAWAMSIHKSQGMTLDRVIVNLTRAFEEGQVYVALSRATSLEGLKIEGDPDGLSVGRGGNPDVQEFLKMKFGATITKYSSND